MATKSYFPSGDRNRQFTLQPTQAKGKGGEADIYLIIPASGGKPAIAAKMFKQPDHPDLSNDPHEQKGAKKRIDGHQTKLRDFPKGLPDKMTRPLELVHEKADPTSRVAGYLMEFKPGEVLLSYTMPTFRRSVPNSQIGLIFSDLHGTVTGAHAKDYVFGDFNDLNVLVNGTQCHVLDVDAGQFGRYFCSVFTDRFLDPLCSEADKMMLVRPYSKGSDWYSFQVMLMQVLLLVGPWGGVHRPKDKTQKVKDHLRALKRMPVWNPDVIYPGVATHYRVLPDDLMHRFHLTFEKDDRQPFPVNLLGLAWQTCPGCGLEHARNACPVCVQAPAAAAVISTTTIRGKVKATRIFKTKGVIPYATYQGNALRWVYSEDGVLKREDGSLALKQPLDPLMRIRIRRANTIIARGDTAYYLDSRGQIVDKLPVGMHGNYPQITANSESRFWISGKQLVRDNPDHPGATIFVCDILQNQTKIWVGADLGLGLYRAGELSVAFIFRTNGPGVNDTLKLPPIKGQMADATAAFASHRIWLFITIQHSGKLRNLAACYDENGTILGQAEAEAGDGSWLGEIRGRCAMGPYLFAPTDDGIKRVEPKNGQLIETQEFPDTAAFVNSGTRLFPGQNCLQAVSDQEITQLQITP